MGQFEVFTMIKSSSEGELSATLQKFTPELGILRMANSKVKERDFAMIYDKVAAMGGGTKEMNMLIGLCIDLYIMDIYKPTVKNLGGGLVGPKLLKLMLDSGILGKGSFGIPRMAGMFPEEVVKARKADELRANQWCMVIPAGTEGKDNFFYVAISEERKLFVTAIDRSVESKTKFDRFAPSNFILTPEGDKTDLLHYKWTFAHRVHTRMMISLQEKGREEAAAKTKAKYEPGKGLSKINMTLQELQGLRAAKGKIPPEVHATWYGTTKEADVQKEFKKHDGSIEKNIFPPVTATKPISFAKGTFVYTVDKDNSVSYQRLPKGLKAEA